MIKKYSSLKCYDVIEVLTFAFIVLMLFKDKLIYMTRFFYKCPFYTRTGMLCTGCGNTRSVIALLNGDILTSLKYNITPIVICVLILLFYAENLIGCLGKQVHLIPRKMSYFIVFLLFMSAYYILRNFIPFLSFL